MRRDDMSVYDICRFGNQTLFEWMREIEVHIQRGAHLCVWFQKFKEFNLGTDYIYIALLLCTEMDDLVEVLKNS